MRLLTLDQISEAQALCIELPKLQERLFRCGMLKTAHAMDKAIQEIGYELAEHLEALAEQS